MLVLGGEVGSVRWLDVTLSFLRMVPKGLHGVTWVDDPFTCIRQYQFSKNRRDKLVIEIIACIRYVLQSIRKYIRAVLHYGMQPYPKSKVPDAQDTASFVNLSSPVGQHSH
jgi:hypothetical protein